MQQYNVKPSQISNDTVEILGDDVHHIRRVVRMKIGATIRVSNGIDIYSAKISNIEQDKVIATLMFKYDYNNELPCKITIVQGLPKGDKLDYIVQKSTELGVFEIAPIELKRSISKWSSEKVEKKIARLNKIAKEASEQSRRCVVPNIDFVKNVQNLVEKYKSIEHKYIAYENENNNVPLDNLITDIKNNNSDKNNELLFVIGPEGGLCESEVQHLMSNGFKTIGIGRRILRTETASSYILSVVGYLYEGGVLK